MIAEAVKQRFEALVRSGDADPAALARAAKQGDMVAAADLGALLARAGFVEPALIRDTYDAAASGWFGDSSPSVSLRGGTGVASSDLWAPFWAFIDDEQKMDAGGFTMRTAQLGSLVDAGFAERAGLASLDYQGVPDAVKQGWPERFQLSELAACPPGSLGAEFHAQIVDNKFDLEVLDRDALGLRQLRPPLERGGDLGIPALAVRPQLFGAVPGHRRHQGRAQAAGRPWPAAGDHPLGLAPWTGIAAASRRGLAGRMERADRRGPQTPRHGPLQVAISA
jgi:hypothetical protein